MAVISDLTRDEADETGELHCHCWYEGRPCCRCSLASCPTCAEADPESLGDCEACPGLEGA